MSRWVQKVILEQWFLILAVYRISWERLFVFFSNKTKQNQNPTPSTLDSNLIGLGQDPDIGILKMFFRYFNAQSRMRMVVLELAKLFVWSTVFPVWNFLFCSVYLLFYSSSKATLILPLLVKLFLTVLAYPKIISLASELIVFNSCMALAYCHMTFLMFQ